MTSARVDSNGCEKSTVLYTKVTEGIRAAIQKSDDKYHHRRRQSTTTVFSTEKEPAEAEYEVHIFTGNVFNASTRANVGISLFGTGANGASVFSGWILLDSTCNAMASKNGRLCFQRGQHDTFVFKCANVGDLKKIRIGHDGIGGFAGWYLDRVTIIDRHTTKSFAFPCSRWLSTTRDDGQIVRDLQSEYFYALKSSDFKPSSSDVISLGGKDTCKDYCPKVFRNLREMYGVNHKEFIESWILAPEKLVAKEGAGRSGSLFLRSNNHQYMMKTIPEDEVASLCNVLPRYYKYLKSSPGSLIMKVFSLLRFEIGGNKLYVMIFNDVMFGVPSELRTATYDLKGRVPKPGKAMMNQGEGSDYIFKDKDLDRVFPVRAKDKVALLKQLDQDIFFFAEANLMDYSMLIGTFTLPEEVSPASFEPPRFNTMLTAKGDREVYCVGFIDCLTRYNWKKKTAHAFKTKLWDSNTLSTIDAEKYAERIRNYLMELFEGSDKDVAVALSYRNTTKTKAGRSLTSSGTLTKLNRKRFTEKKVEYIETAADTIEKDITNLEHLIELVRNAVPVNPKAVTGAPQTNGGMSNGETHIDEQSQKPSDHGRRSPEATLRTKGTSTAVAVEVAESTKSSSSTVRDPVASSAANTAEGSQADGGAQEQSPAEAQGEDEVGGRKTVVPPISPRIEIQAPFTDEFDPVEMEGNESSGRTD